jgi:hypothetical protein
MLSELRDPYTLKHLYVSLVRPNWNTQVVCKSIFKSEVDGHV